MAQTHYEVLGVDKDATPQEIKKSFRRIARECHPDVAADDPAASDRFKAARDAYEVLIDPVKRARYDRRGKRRGAAPGPGNFFDAFYQRTGERAQRVKPRRVRPSRRARHDPANNLDLEDLFSDFGDFGYGGGSARPSQPGRPEPRPGRDVAISLDVPERVAREGGTVTAVYYRQQRSESWTPSSRDPGLLRVQEVADVRILPATRHGQVLRERGLGDAGPHGGPYGDLQVRVQVIPAARRPEPEPAPDPPEEAEVAPDGPAPVEQRRLDLTVAEAILGGRIRLDTPQGPVVLAIPPGTSGGRRIRLRGRGPEVEGQATDLIVETRIVVPEEVGAEGCSLIEAFARLHPESPER